MSELVLPIAPDRTTALAHRHISARRRWRARIAMGAAYLAAAAALAPLAAVMAFTLARGAGHLSATFLTHSMAGITPLSAGGGVYHAMVGTIEQVGLAALIAIPLALLVAVFLSEAPVRHLAPFVRLLVDVMTGIPSIVAGLFVFAFWVVGLHQGFSGVAGALALAILMLPVIVRTSEEMLRLVPVSLREASLALGVPKWRTVWSVVLPAARSGVTTGVLLAVARVTGETAPLLLTVGNNAFINTNPLRGQQASLSVFVFDQTRRSFDVAVQRAWAGAVVLIGFIAVLYVAARIITRTSSTR